MPSLTPQQQAAELRQFIQARIDANRRRIATAGSVKLAEDWHALAGWESHRDNVERWEGQLIDDPDCITDAVASSEAAANIAALYAKLLGGAK